MAEQFAFHDKCASADRLRAFLIDVDAADGLLAGFELGLRASRLPRLEMA